MGSAPPGSSAFRSRSSIGIDLERRGELVHLRLGCEAGLDRTEPAHRAAGRVVRVHAEAVDQHVVAGVRADGERARVRDDRGRARCVGAAVQEDPHPHRDELPRSGRAVLGPDPRGMAMDVPDERLLAVVDHLHGPARAQGEQRRVRLDGEILPPAERAARHPPDGSAPAPAGGRGTARSGRGRRGATASRRGCRLRPRRPESRCRTPGRETPDPAGRSRSSRRP